MRRISGEPDVDLVAAHLDGLGRPRLRVTQDDTGTAAILAEARIYSDAGAVAELIEDQPLPAAALTPGATIELSSAWPRTITHADGLGRVLFTRDADGRETATNYGPLWTERRDHEDLHPAPPYQNMPERSDQEKGESISARSCRRASRDRRGRCRSGDPAVPRSNMAG